MTKAQKFYNEKYLKDRKFGGMDNEILKVLIDFEMFLNAEKEGVVRNIFWCSSAGNTCEYLNKRTRECQYHKECSFRNRKTT